MIRVGFTNIIIEREQRAYYANIGFLKNLLVRYS